MTFVITRSCCNDASCVEVCPVDCIHPTPDEPGFAEAEMLYIHPDECIDCGSCVDACPAGAVYPGHEVPAHLASYLAVNADYFDFTGDPPAPGYPPAAGPRATEQTEPLRVAVIGSGPAGWYVADELSSNRRAETEVTVVDRLLTPGGLVRFGVAPDHLDTKGVTGTFDKIAAHRRTRTAFGVSVGTDISHAELLSCFHAVVYATGASAGRSLGLAGETLPGSVAAADLVGWYAGHPDLASLGPGLSSPRAVVIGNGNVGLDVARLLLSSREALEASDVTAEALELLDGSSVEEVVVVARRGPADAAFTSPELRALIEHPDFDVVVSPSEVEGLEALLDPDERNPATFAAKEKATLLLEAAATESAPDRKRLVLRFGLTPEAILGDTAVTGLRVVPTSGGESEVIEAGLVVRATGYRSTAVDGVPFDEERGTFHHEGGRILDPADDNIVPGTYVSGWAKRGPSGVIGTNRSCAAETARAVLDDYVAGRLATPERAGEFESLLASRGVSVVDHSGWKLIDNAEVAAGTAAGRPRVKITDPIEQLKIAGAAQKA
ncbi:FAD-dependent oxidoreductase [Nocardioides sp. Kera G14]|uniref:FAD-dependent oxidoreductase n=1 Tax=Nocardioides sp. Kera G14 TaxID=2884264 RepID=UPI001D1294EA|nr:FAD-dependent oxidoreductase [Nocardioides sp. Kera G14]UDY22197.1 FAD-dependent oxidoreductase [Nocardioides sp. Kera G14]